MNSIQDKINNFDGYLSSCSLVLSATGKRIIDDGNHVSQGGDPGYWRPLGAWLLIIPAELISIMGTVTCLAKLTFQLSAKIVLESAALCGSIQARQWSNSIDISLTARKTLVFAMGVIMHTVAIPLICIGGFMHIAYFNFLILYAQKEMQIQIDEKFKEKIDQNPQADMMELTSDDISQIASKVIIHESTIGICTSGLASEAIASGGEKFEFSIQEMHLNQDGSNYENVTTRKFDYIIDFSTSVRLKNDINEINYNGFSSDKINGKPKYKWILKKNNSEAEAVKQ